LIHELATPEQLCEDSELPQHISTLLPHLTNSGRRQLTLAELVAILEQPMTHLLVAYDDKNGLAAGMCLTFCVLTPTHLFAYLDAVVVHPHFRRRGWAEQLVREAIEIVKYHSAAAELPTTLELTSKPKREAANAMYQKMGFKLVAAAVPDDPDGTNLYRLRIRS